MYYQVIRYILEICWLINESNTNIKQQTKEISSYDPWPTNFEWPMKSVSPKTNIICALHGWLMSVFIWKWDPVVLTLLGRHSLECRARVLSRWGSANGTRKSPHRSRLCSGPSCPSHHRTHDSVGQRGMSYLWSRLRHNKSHYKGLHSTYAGKDVVWWLQ